MAAVATRWAPSILAPSSPSVSHRRRLVAAGIFDSRRPRRVSVRDAKATLLDVLARDPTGFGDPRNSDVAAVEASVEALAGVAPPWTPRSGGLGGAWNLEWTSETDVHAIVRSLPVRGIQQDIEVRGGAQDLGQVTNRILLSLPGGIPARLEAVADVQEASPRRLAYAFRSFAVVLGGGDGFIRLPLPVMGSGWTKATFLDADLRVMQNSRGDTLVLTRCCEE